MEKVQQATIEGLTLCVGQEVIRHYPSDGIHRRCKIEEILIHPSRTRYAIRGYWEDGDGSHRRENLGGADFHISTLPYFELLPLPYDPNQQSQYDEEGDI